jgi:predicted ribosome quality control (RQC) complex YloA/Tae2 family protein
MPIRYDPPLATALAIEARQRWLGRRVEYVWLDHERRSAWLGFADLDGGTESLAFLLHPSAGYILTASAPAAISSSPEGTRIPFRRLYLTDVWAPVDERLIVLDLAGGRRDIHRDRPPVFRLNVELHTNQWNVVLTSGTTGRIEAVLWSRTAGGRTLRRGAVYRSPEGAREWAERIPKPAQWTARMGALAPGERRASLVRTAAWTSSINVDWVLGPAARTSSPTELDAALRRYASLRELTSGEAWILERDDADQPYPLRLGGPARPSSGLLVAMRRVAEEAGALPSGEAGSGGAEYIEGTIVEAPGTENERVAAAEEAQALERELVRRVSAVRRRREALERQLRGEDAERLRQLGHLLLARREQVKRGAERVILEGFEGEPVEVELDPGLDAVRNANSYYDRARRRDRAAAILPERIREATRRLDALEAGLRHLRAAGATGELWELVGGRTRDTDASRAGVEPLSDPQTFPYRRYRSSGGLEIRVGRSARGNDELTFRHSAPEDIWLHARQAAGAHVILRWDRRDQNPPRADLSEAAVLAAVHSEARHSGLVAGDWTRRKYVRKPRKAAPGTVIPDRVQTLFIEPDSTMPSRLSTED